MAPLRNENAAQRVIRSQDNPSFSIDLHVPFSKERIARNDETIGNTMYQKQHAIGLYGIDLNMVVR